MIFFPEHLEYVPRLSPTITKALMFVVSRLAKEKVLMVLQPVYLKRVESTVSIMF